jgi:hypothetical protein
MQIGRHSQTTETIDDGGGAGGGISGIVEFSATWLSGGVEGIENFS